MFIIVKPTRCNNFSNLFWNETLHVSDSSSVHHQEFFTVHIAIGVCHTGLLTACEQKHMLLLASCRQTCMTYTITVCTVKNSWWWTEEMLLLASCQQTCMTYNIAVCTVKNSWWWTEELSESCRVSFQNKFEKLVHLVGFIIRNLSRCTVSWTSDSFCVFHVELTLPQLLSRYLRINT